MSTEKQHYITEARGDRLIEASGCAYVDLNMGYGSVWLGHGNAAVTHAVRAQLERYSAPGFLPHAAFCDAEAALAPFIPSSHRLGGFYSTGMEAMETALRAARAHTARHHVAGFEGGTHGRSAITSALGAPDPALPLPFVHRLPPLSTPVAVLERALRELIARTPLAAIVVEPVQMTAGGHALDPGFAVTLTTLARAHGIAVVFDETLTGLHRCGPRLWCDRLEAAPDIVVLGKGLANGLPASAVIIEGRYTWDRARVKPGSTFYNHPLTCAAVAATLRELSAVDAPRRVAAIADVVRAELALDGLRGEGALWSLELPDTARQHEFIERVRSGGVVVSYYAGHVRITPAVTVDLTLLAGACGVIRRAYADTFG